jgi:hypothetical protein
MKLYERLGDSGFHSSIISTFGIDFDAYESIVLTRLSAAGCRNNIVVADERMLLHALAGASILPRRAGRQYSISGATARGVFHPKLFLQVGRRRGRLIVASANVTASGLAGNLELAGSVECSDEASAAQRIVAAGWGYLRGHLDQNRSSIGRQLAWLQARASWLLTAESSMEAVPLADGTALAFFATDEATGIMERFIRQIGSDHIERLVVLSPYWDEDLAALIELCERVRPSDVVLLVDKKRALFPGPALQHVPTVRVLDVASLGDGRFIHAKLIVASSTAADHVLYGSANCTIAALGRQHFSGTNEEACLYRRLPSGSTAAVLGLDSVLAQGNELTAQDLPPLAVANELPLEEIARRNPGIFECAFTTLTWWAPKLLGDAVFEIELLDADQRQTSCTLEPLAAGVGGGARYRVMGDVNSLAFGRLRFGDGTISAVAVVARVEVLLASARDRETRAGTRPAERLDEETEIDLFLLEVLDDLEAADAEDTEVATRRGKRVQHALDAPEPCRVLDYAAFLAGRAIRPEKSELGRDSLAGTEQDLVRVFLNRVLAIDAVESQISDDEEDEEGLKRAFDLGDEVEDAGKAIEGGDSFNSPPQGLLQRLPQERQKEAERRNAERRRANRGQIVAAVGGLRDRLRGRVMHGGLTTRDLLRVRAVLSIVAAAGWAGRDGTRIKGGGPLPSSTRQVLPISGSDDRWPRLLGLTLHALFRGSDPPVRHLQIDVLHDQMPDDVIECWATCFWAAQAIVVASAADQTAPMFTHGLKPLIENVYLLTGLTTQELLGDPIIGIMLKLGNHYAARLGFDVETLMTAHRRTVAEVFGSRR